MSHARIEEVSDSDPDIDDPSEYLPDADNAIIRSRNETAAPPQPQSSSSSQQQSRQSQQSVNPSLLQGGIPQTSNLRSAADVERQREAIKHYCMLYPCYFSSNRTRHQGRRVSKELAVPSPLAWNVLQALRHVIEPDVNRVHIAFEPDKTHPKDWANPGRVRVELFDKETHKPRHPTIHNKEHLYIEVAKWLKQHPTKESDPLELKIAGLPVPENFLETKTPKPRGWGTMNEILPLHSAAVSGGGVNDNFMQQALEEMKQMQGSSGAGGGGAGTPPAGMEGMGGMAGLQQMMQSMGGMGGLGGMLGGGGGQGAGGGEGSGGGKKKKDKKK